MYFYVLEGGSYEEYYKTVFFSERRYSSNEFMQIVKEAYRMSCEDRVKKYGIPERCDFCLTVESILWRKHFNSIVEKISDLTVIHGDEKISVGTCTTPNENTREIERSLLDSDIDDCRSNCSEEDGWLKKLKCKYIDYVYD